MGRVLKRSKTKSEKVLRGALSAKYMEVSEEIGLSHQSVEQLAVKRTIEYFKMHDYLFNTNYTQVMESVYLTKGNNYKTKERLSMDLHMSLRSIIRVTNLVIRCFDKYMSLQYDN